MVGEILVSEAPPRHIPHQEDEYFHVLQGEIEFEVSNETILGKAEYVFQPAGIEHYFEEVSKIIVAQEDGWQKAANEVAVKYGTDMLDSPDWSG
ncbi:unnamed protein product [Adineta steineri]|uniref:Cupin type-2 domain-containing protein n=1 Tax=Adineta steineri TaxID=433720 RepID=A0A815SRD7_9BILA|nr:unnamed protein product [Adineta steineri]CAF1495327.1 unnamed protein product [Adineta steineri]CAF3789827.1 unnamed protein product [Adineta steineri]CAF4018366.1 unnamed protein product [Adineta steineri]CAF4102878.1 unnamed protein product [Adineta steineri]